MGRLHLPERLPHTRRRRVKRCLAAIAHDPIRLPVAEEIAKMVNIVGADRGALMYTGRSTDELHPFVLIDSRDDNPDSPESTHVHRRGVHSAHAHRLWGGKATRSTRGALLVVQGDDRSWYLVLERKGERMAFGEELAYPVEIAVTEALYLIQRQADPSPLDIARALARAEQIEDAGDLKRALAEYQEVREAAISQASATWLAAALLRIGRTLRQLGEWDASLAVYGQAKALSVATEQRGNQARALLGGANVHRVRGNLPLASKTYKESLAQAKAAEDYHCVGLCEHGLSYMELSTGDPEAGIVRAWAAYEAYPEQRDRSRVLSLLGNGWMKLGHFGEARCAYEILAALSDPGEARAMALDALSQVAARDGDEPGYRLAISRADAEGVANLSTNSRGQVLFHRGESLLRLGYPDEARVALNVALAFASAHKLGVLIHQVEELAATHDLDPNPEPIKLRRATLLVKRAVEVERLQLLAT